MKLSITPAPATAAETPAEAVARIESQAITYQTPNSSGQMLGHIWGKGKNIYICVVIMVKNPYLDFTE